MSVDASLLKKGVKVSLSNGRHVVVNGCYMSPDGIVVIAKDGDLRFNHNIPLRDVVDIVKEGD